MCWFRRDLRLGDNPALLEALDRGEGQTIPLFVLDPYLWSRAGVSRRTYLAESLRALNESLAGQLLVLEGQPWRVIPELAANVGATSVHAAEDFGPYGRLRDHRVATELGTGLVLTGSPYAANPGTVLKSDGTPYRVFTPFYRAWRDRGWGEVAGPPTGGTWIRPVEGTSLPAVPDGQSRWAAGEAHAQDRWAEFLSTGLANYPTDRDRPDLSSSSGLSAALRWGELHPRTLLSELGEDADAESFRRQLAWREFYADVLHHHPQSKTQSLRSDLADLRWDHGATAEDRFAAWAEGRTGFPFVDAGMRQLRTEGWMHNRLRMVTASFLVKDLHIDWTRGAREFMHWLRDGDLASNGHGWQWVAGVGTDAAPFFRVFNPVSQGLRFDPHGDYVRRYIPELRTVRGAAVHEPWTLSGGLPSGYPERIVDHASERMEALARYSIARELSKGSR